MGDTPQHQPSDQPPSPPSDQSHGPLHRPDDGVDVDLVSNAAGIGVTHEAARRRHRDGVGADLSWRVGADGEASVGQLLDTFCAPRWIDRLRGRAPGWRVLHSVPLGDAQGRVRGDVDHLLIGPPGLGTINTKHHRVGRVVCDGDRLTVNRHDTPYVPKARREADRVRRLITPALTAAGHADLAAALVVFPVIVLITATLQVRRPPNGVLVVRASGLTHPLQTMTHRLTPGQTQTVFEVARWHSTWVHPPNPPGEHHRTKP